MGGLMLMMALQAGCAPETAEPLPALAPARPCRAGVVVALKHEPWHWHSVACQNRDGTLRVESVPDPGYLYQVRLCNADDEATWWGVPRDVWAKLRVGDWYEPPKR